MNRKRVRPLALILAFVSLLTLYYHAPELSIETQAAGNLTSIGLAEFGIQAKKDNWKYVYGAQGERVNGRRQSDCSGLIHAYFTDNGVGSGYAPRNVTRQVENSVLHGAMDTLPRVHGALVTYNNNDHVGIYIGNGIEVDNSHPGPGGDMHIGEVSYKGWVKWHLLDAGIKYPKSGFYAFNGNMYHYSDFQYDVNTSITNNGTTYTIGEDGIVKDSSGKAIPVDSSMPNSGFFPASDVSFQKSFTPPAGTVPTAVAADGVKLYSQASPSNPVADLPIGSTVYVNLNSKTEGESFTTQGKTSNIWYQATTKSGQQGYISSIFTSAYVPIETKPPVEDKPVYAPSIAVGSDYRVYMGNGNQEARIYYTTDCTDPTPSNGLIYDNPLVNFDGTTYRAITVHGDKVSTPTTLTVIANGTIFTDLTTDEWYYRFVEESILREYFAGNGDETFGPNNGITRAEFVTVLAKASGDDLSGYTSTSFSDVPNEWYLKFIAWSQDQKLVAGYSNNTFRPNALITREEMCVILAKYLGFDTGESLQTNFSDNGQISDWARTAVKLCNEAGIVNGKGNHRFAPLDSATRAETSTMLVNSL